MAMVTRETSGLELHINSKGRMVLKHAGVTLPLSSISIDGGAIGERGSMQLTLLNQFVTFVHDEVKQ